MSNKLAGGIKAGTTSYSTDIVLLSVTDGTEMTGKIAADVTAYYWRQGGTPTAISLSNLAAITTAWTSGGIKEAEATNMKGSYRLDVPDAAFATGADWVEVDAFCTGSQVYKERFALETVGAAEVKVDTAAIKIKTDTISGDPWDELSAAHNTAGTMGAKMNAAGSAADPLANPVPGAYAAGTAGAVIGSNLWDQVAASHNTAGTMGAKVNAAGTAADPWAVAIPAAYGAGTAGQVLGTLFTTALPESYAADGVPVTLNQAIYMIMQYLTEQAISGTAMTVKRLDGSTTAYVVTLNSATTPTAKTRSS